MLKNMAHCFNVTHQMEYLLATGTLRTKSGLGLMQVYSRSQSGHLCILFQDNHNSYLMLFLFQMFSIAKKVCNNVFCKIIPRLQVTLW